MSEETHRAQKIGQQRLFVSRVFCSASNLGGDEISPHAERPRNDYIRVNSTLATYAPLGTSRQRPMLLVARRLVMPVSWVGRGGVAWRWRRGLWLKD